MAVKPAGMDMERNYVTVTLRIPMYVLTFRDLCVCCCVGHQHEPRINGSTDEMSFEEDTRVSLRTMFYVGVHSGATWQIRRIDLCGGGDAVCRYHYWNNFYNRPFTVPVRPTPHKKCKQSRQTFGCQTNVPYRCQTTTAPARIVTREIKPTILPRKVRNPAQNYTRNPKLFPSQSACTQTSAAPIQDGWRTLCDDVTSRWNAAAENQGCARLNERRLEMVCTKFSIKWMVYWTK